MFITFEGPEGGGKSTQIKMLAEWLRSKGKQVVMTREPGGTPIAEQIRGVIIDVNNTAMVSRTEILLYSAARAQHVEELIRPSLADGKIVLCDRYVDSTYAYQGYGRGLDLVDLQTMTAFATDGLLPDITFLLDLDVEKGLARRMDNEEEMNRLDLEAIDFHQKVRAGYHSLADAEPNRFQLINADRPLQMIQAELQFALLML